MTRPRPLRVIAAACALVLGAAALSASPASAASRPTNVILVAPDGKKPKDLHADQVVRTLDAAQTLARAKNSTADVRVLLTGGTYELDQPLRFGSRDGGRNGHTVTWQSVPGQHAVLSGGSKVTGWTLTDPAKNIWSADVPVGSRSRQLYVDGQLAQRTQLLLAESKKTRDHLVFSQRGLTVNDPALAERIAGLSNPGDLEIEELGSFTDRYSPVQTVDGSTLVMEQPAWDNNNFGYDTLKSPYNRGAIYLNNAYELLSGPNQWYLDSAKGKVFYRPADGQSMAATDVRLPRLESLVQVSGSYRDPVQNLAFSNLTFAHTTWNSPSGPQGYVDQQSGAHIVGEYAKPADFLTSCQDGCPEFEKTRNEWHQIPAAVQVSAAEHVAFDGNSFEQLGSVGLGLGMDPNAHASGIGYGAAEIDVRGNSFTNSAASAIVAGGVQPDAHHPRDPRMTNHDVRIVDNTIKGVSKNYRDNAGILSTYVTRATITHNTLTDLPYDGVDIGWGWGINDPGGNQYYLEAGLYNYQPIYRTPTTFLENYVAYNLIHDTKQAMHDGGSIYTLSSSPGTVIERNYVYDSQVTFGALIDQGTRYVVMRDNVFLGSSRWVYINADAGNPDTFNTKDNLVTGNWWDVGPARNPEGPGYNNQVIDNTQITDGVFPPEARKVMTEAGARR
ncbi:right-handed parallel beta-helix repeat-containing protein [Kribbella soli]|uniref:Right-handed parallel beta-helix repeat-containing protein n=1 Tax=Kribbella soli TaxID=1124743 RepID=A0A4R0H1L8_9ACTN|nr:right-handed parallel beta-helix repeat-containing protein [Kribbella soli]TCC01589.1 right-handed parallel beta-helix repeat-containing protein [Kribbella soli]